MSSTSSQVFPDLNEDKLRSAFAMFDKDNSGTIDAAEMRSIFEFISGEAPPQNVIDHYMTSLDANKDGVISFSEIQTLFQMISQELIQQVDAMRELFQNLDANGDGKVDMEEAASALKAINHIPGLSTEKILATCFTPDGVLSYQAFARMVLSSGRNRMREAMKAMDDAVCSCPARILKNFSAKPKIIEETDDDDEEVKEQFAPIQQSLDELSAKYGLKIVWNETLDPWQGVDKDDLDEEELAMLSAAQVPFEAKRCNRRLMTFFAPLFVEELSVYPPSFFLKGEQNANCYDWIERINVCTDVQVGGQRVGGFALVGSQTLVINADAIFPSDDSDDDDAVTEETAEEFLKRVKTSWELSAFKQVLHHELFHLFDFCLAVERNDSDPQQDTVWRALNAEGFQYDNEKNEDGQYSTLSTYDLKPGSGPAGFINSYQLASAWEDKGCTYGSLFAFPGYCEKAAKTDRVLAAKINTMKATLQKYCPEMSEEGFWKSRYFEEYKALGEQSY